ncbi:MAG: DUF1360 domain-containing protein [Patulibacter sp.]|nr:DUF1360 domain-containing protein [Patulibacter sp.]
MQATPTRPADYALISGAYATALTAVAWSTRARAERLDVVDVTYIGLATFTFTRVLTEQKVETWLRRPFVVEPADGPSRPRGRGMRYAIGELLSCTRCTGSWVGLGLVGLQLRNPRLGRLVAAVGTVGAVNDTALAAFAWLTGRANAIDGRVRS